MWPSCTPARTAVMFGSCIRYVTEVSGRLTSEEVSLKRRLGGPQSRSDRFGKQTLCLPGIEPRFLDQYSLVTIPAILRYDTKNGSDWCDSAYVNTSNAHPVFKHVIYPSPKPNGVHSMSYPWPVTHSVKTQRLKLSRLARRVFKW